MSPSPGLAPVRARSLSGHCIDKSDHSVSPRQWQRPGEPSSSPKQAIPCGLTTSAFCQNTSASCLKPASDCLRTPHCAKKHASLPLLQWWPKSCTGSPRPESWASATRWELRLVIDLSIDNAVAAPEVDCLHPAGRSGRRSCLRSVMPLETCFQKMAGVSSFARGNPSVAGDVRGIRRQITVSRSIKALVGRCRKLPPISGTACSRSLQALIHNAGILPPDCTPQTSLTGSAESGVRLFRLNLLGMILLAQDLFFELKATSYRSST